MRNPAYLVVLIIAYCAFSAFFRSLLDLSEFSAICLGVIPAILGVTLLFDDLRPISIHWIEALLWGIVPTLLIFHWPTQGLNAWHTADAANHLSNLRVFFDPTHDYATLRDRLVNAPAFYVYWRLWSHGFGEVVGLKIALYSTVFFCVVMLRVLAGGLPRFSRAWFGVAIFLVALPVFHYLMIEGFFRHFWSLLVYISAIWVFLQTTQRWWVSAFLMTAIALSSYGLYVGDLWMIAVLSGMVPRTVRQGFLSGVLLLPVVVLYLFLYQVVIFNDTVGLIYHVGNFLALFALSFLLRRLERVPVDALDRVLVVSFVSTCGWIFWAGAEAHYALKYPLIPWVVVGVMALSQRALPKMRWIQGAVLLPVLGFWVSVGPVFLDRIFQRSDGTPIMALVDSRSTQQLDEWLKQGAHCNDALQTWTHVPWPRRAFWFAQLTNREASPVCYSGMTKK